MGMRSRQEHPAAAGKWEAIALRRAERDRRHEHAKQRREAMRRMHPEAEQDPADQDRKG